jgi:hypothetical protein
MSLSDLSNVGGFVSGISVLVTLLFLLVQIRQANQNQRAIVQQGRATRIADFLLRVIDPSLLPAWTMGLAGAAEIGPDRHFQFMYMARARFLSLEDSFLQHRNGLMDEGAFVGHVEAFKLVFGARGLKAAWKLTRFTYDRDFADFVDSLDGERLAPMQQTSVERWLEVVQSQA